MERGNVAKRSNSRRLARRVSEANQPDEVGPDARGKPSWLLLGRLPEVTRRKGGTGIQVTTSAAGSLRSE